MTGKDAAKVQYLEGLALSEDAARRRPGPLECDMIFG
jgi:hypothetical protein